jgi:hypothetical protein
MRVNLEMDMPANRAPELAVEVPRVETLAVDDDVHVDQPPLAVRGELELPAAACANARSLALAGERDSQLRQRAPQSVDRVAERAGRCAGRSHMDEHNPWMGVSADRDQRRR